MKKRYRIKKVNEIDAVFAARKSEGDPYFVVYHQPNEQAQNFRFAISIGRKYGSSVERNLCKRRIRMIIHQYKAMIDNSKQFVVVVKPKAKSLSFQEMNDKIVHLLRKSKTIESKEEK